MYFFGGSQYFFFSFFRATEIWGSRSQDKRNGNTTNKKIDFYFSGKHFTKCLFGLGWNARLRFSFFFYSRVLGPFFFSAHSLLWLLFMNSSRKVWLFPHFQHKFHFSAIFSLKMGPTVLFTHLKIILLQYFSVSVFSFQLYPNGL